MKLRQFNRHGEELAVLDVEAAESFFPSPADREAVELAARVVALLDTRKASIAVDSSEVEADDYDGSVSVSEWLHRKSH
jgi:hypothetical protein